MMAPGSGRRLPTGPAVAAPLADAAARKDKTAHQLQWQIQRHIRDFAQSCQYMKGRPFHVHATQMLSGNA